MILATVLCCLVDPHQERVSETLGESARGPREHRGDGGALSKAANSLSAVQWVGHPSDRLSWVRHCMVMGNYCPVTFAICPPRLE